MMSASVGSYASLQWVQSRRASRWASTPDSEDVTRNGSTPISIKRIGRRRGIVGVEGGQHHVTGQSGLDRDRRSLLVPDLTDQHDVRVGSQDGPERGGEIEAGLEVQLDLVDPLERQLDRVLDGDDVLLGRVERGQRRVERGRLA